MKFLKRLAYNLAAAAVAALLVLFGGRLSTPKKASDSIRVTTWNLQWFPNGSAKPAPAGKQVQTIATAARVLAKLDPDVILLQEIRDREACDRLVEALAPVKYEVLVCSDFREGMGNAKGYQQVAILAKEPADGAWAAGWKTKGLVDPPRGYAFAVIPFGKTQVGFYALHLKSNLTRNNPEQENQLNILKRETAVEQLIEHARAMGKDYPRMTGVVVGGDFNTNPDQEMFAREKTLGLFTKAGFSDPFAQLALDDRVTHPGKGRYPDATFDYLFFKGLNAARDVMIEQTKASDHLPVTMDFKLNLKR